MVYLGVDLGGSHIAAGVVAENGRLLAKAEGKTPLHPSAEQLADAIALLCREAMAQANVTPASLPYVGLGAPGAANQSTGLVEHLVNLHLDNWPARALLEERLGLPVRIENDANAAAWAEYRAGCLRGAQSAILVTLGTGIGGGILQNGQLLTGCNHNAGEIGCMVIQAVGGRRCTCGRRGCWEQYASASALVRDARAAVQKNAQAGNGGLLWQLAGQDPARVDGRLIFAAARQQDPLALRLVRRYIAYLGCGLTNLVNIFQPEVIGLGGGISAQSDLLLPPLRKLLAAQRISQHSAVQTQLKAAELGNDAGIIGAALLGVDAPAAP